MPTVCLNMIVKNEVEVLPRCFESVLPHIHHWVICDTGSTDGTQELIQDWFASRKLPGTLLEHPWRDFGHNRTLALSAARESADYVLIMDADDLLVATDDFEWGILDADAYRIRHKFFELDHYKERLVRADQPWRWEGVLHEYLTCDGPARIENLTDGPWISSRSEGARSQDPKRFERDAQILEAALEREPHNLRYRFYLAQSHRDAGNLKAALHHYRLRADAGGWEEEAFYSRYQIGRILERMDRPWSECLEAHLQAWKTRPQRLEPLHRALRICREQGLWSVCLQLALAARQVPRTRDILFVEVDVYRWRVFDEWAVASTWLGRWDEAAALNRRILADPTVPADDRERVLANLDLCKTHLHAAA